MLINCVNLVFFSTICPLKVDWSLRELEPHRLVLWEVMAELAKRLLDLNICSFLPDHSNNLANQFRWLCFVKDRIDDFSFQLRCFANFDLDGLISSDKNTSEAPL